MPPPLPSGRSGSRRLREARPRPPACRANASRQEYRSDPVRGTRRRRLAAAPPNTGVTMATKHRLDVLVVDADESTTVEIKDLLSEDGFQVHVLSDPARTVDEVRRGRYQLVLLDVSPPADRGVDLLQQIRAVDS